MFFDMLAANGHAVLIRDDNYLARNFQLPYSNGDGRRCYGPQWMNQLSRENCRGRQS